MSNSSWEDKRDDCGNSTAGNQRKENVKRECKNVGDSQEMDKSEIKIGKMKD